MYVFVATVTRGFLEGRGESTATCSDPFTKPRFVPTQVLQRHLIRLTASETNEYIKI